MGLTKKLGGLKKQDANRYHDEQLNTHLTSLHIVARGQLGHVQRDSGLNDACSHCNILQTTLERVHLRFCPALPVGASQQVTSLTQLGLLRTEHQP
jgi:hypothetical protein